MFGKMTRKSSNRDYNTWKCPIFYNISIKSCKCFIDNHWFQVANIFHLMSNLHIQRRIFQNISHLMCKNRWKLQFFHDFFVDFWKNLKYFKLCASHLIRQIIFCPKNAKYRSTTTIYLSKWAKICIFEVFTGLFCKKIYIF